LNTHFCIVHFLHAHAGVPAVLLYLAEYLVALYHARAAGLVVLQPYEFPVAKFLEPVGDMLRHYMGMDIDLQSQKLKAEIKKNVLFVNITSAAAPALLPVQVAQAG